MDAGGTELQERMDTTVHNDSTVYNEENNDRTMVPEIVSPDDFVNKHSRSLVKVSKKLMARYIVVNRCVCIFMVWIHLSMGLVSIIASYNSSEVTSESQLCRYVFYSSHYFYGYINMMISVLYIYLFAAFSVTAIRNLRDADWILLIFCLLVIYILGLKAMGDINCTFWGISTSQLIMQGTQFALEGVLLKLFYNWLYNKTILLKKTLEENIDMDKADQYIKKPQ